MTEDIHVSVLAIERSLAGELDTATARTLREHLDTCASCRDRHARIAAEHARWRASPAPAVGLATLLRVHHRETRRRAWAGAGVALAAVAVIALVVVRRPVASDAPTTRSKGGTSFSVVRRDAAGTVTAMVDGTRVRPGDAIRFVLDSARAAEVAIIAFDRRTVTVYAPQPGTASIHLDPGRPHTVDGSIILDATPGAERVIAVFCPDLGSLAGAIAGAEAAHARAGKDPLRVELVTPCTQQRLDYTKDAP